jgi:imidazolonepropionase-like amidohydrolase
VLATSDVIFYLQTLNPTDPPPRGHLALVGATVLTGPDLKPQPDGTVLIGDGVIVKVGPPTPSYPRGASPR